MSGLWLKVRWNQWDSGTVGLKTSGTPMRLTPELVIDSEEDQQSFRQNLLRKGLEHFKERRFKAAEERWMLLLSIDPQCHAAHRNLAVLKRVRRGR